MTFMTNVQVKLTHLGEQKTAAPVHSDLMTSENADTVSTEDIPEADGAVRWPCGQIVSVGMKTSASDISQVTSKYSQRLVVICCPKSVAESKKDI